MKLTVIGGSGGTGALLASQALAAGHEVTVVSRSGRGPEGCRAVACDAGDPAARDELAEAVAGSDAVAVTVGGAKGVENQRARVTSAVVAAMRRAGVRRLLVQSSLGAGDSAKQLPAALRGVVRLALAKPLADHNLQESAVERSGLDWTIVRPSGLTDKPATGSWQVLEISEPGTLGGSIPRADVAALMLRALETDATIGQRLGVSG